jgi:hypothetical protein
MQQLGLSLSQGVLVFYPNPHPGLQPSQGLMQNQPFLIIALRVATFILKHPRSIDQSSKSVQLLPRVYLDYIEGRQDKKTPYHNLCLLAQLNVDADRIRGHYHELSFSHSPFAILSPSTRAHILSKKEQ